ncbi:hypothetical protein [Acetomicrobium sp.]|uniref:hypothetical protein n=1 Tax=Acetomicrobium sp. TaxID=1872099 RepID=UPI002FCB963F
MKGSNYLEALAGAEVAVFDKTGTLTKGTFEVQEVVSKGIYNNEEILKFAACAESFSNHPVSFRSGVHMAKKSAPHSFQTSKKYLGRASPPPSTAASSQRETPGSWICLA